MVWIILWIFSATIVWLFFKSLDRDCEYEREHQERLEKYMEQHKGDIE